jgi:hypothetical protein
MHASQKAFKSTCFTSYQYNILLLCERNCPILHTVKLAHQTAAELVLFVYTPGEVTDEISVLNGCRPIQRQQGALQNARMCTSLQQQFLTFSISCPMPLLVYQFVSFPHISNDSLLWFLKKLKQLFKISSLPFLHQLPYISIAKYKKKDKEICLTAM